MSRICLISFMTVALLLTIVGSSWAQDNPVTVPFSDPARPGTLRVNVMSGSLSVKAYNGKDVIIQTKARSSSSGRSRSQREAEAQGLRRLEAVSTGLSIEEDNNVMTITTNRMNSSEIEIQVPTRTNLKLAMTNGDNMVIEGVDGDIEANNQNGNLSLNDVAGSVVAHSTNGNVIATVKRVAAQKPMSFISMNGKVDVTLPPDTKANLKLRTDNGDVWTDFDVQIKPNTAPPETPTRVPGRPFRIQVDRSIMGAINGGGPDFEIRSFNGNVYIRKLK
jgi:hypothetical protein